MSSNKKKNGQARKLMEKIQATTPAADSYRGYSLFGNTVDSSLGMYRANKTKTAVQGRKDAEQARLAGEKPFLPSGYPKEKKTFITGRSPASKHKSIPPEVLVRQRAGKAPKGEDDDDDDNEFDSTGAPRRKRKKEGVYDNPYKQPLDPRNPSVPMITSLITQQNTRMREVAPQDNGDDIRNIPRRSSSSLADYNQVDPVGDMRLYYQDHPRPAIKVFPQKYMGYMDYKEMLYDATGEGDGQQMQRPQRLTGIEGGDFSTPRGLSSHEAKEVLFKMLRKNDIDVLTPRHKAAVMRLLGSVSPKFSRESKLLRRTQYWNPGSQLEVKYSDHHHNPPSPLQATNFGLAPSEHPKITTARRTIHKTTQGKIFVKTRPAAASVGQAKIWS